MAAPTFFGAGSLVTATSGTSINSVGYPASIALNDVALLEVYSNVSRTPTTPSGWTPITGTANATFSRFWYWRRLDGTETSFNITMSSSMSTTNVGAARIHVYRGCVTTGDPFEDATASSLTTSQNPASSTIDTTGPDRRVVCLLGIDNDAEAVDWSTMPGSGWTLDGSIATWNFTGDGTALSVSKTQASAGTVTGSTIGTYTITSSAWATLTLALIPAAGGTTVPDAPTSLSGIAGDGEVDLTWSAPADDGGETITSYVVEVREEGGDWVQAGLTTIGVASNVNAVDETDLWSGASGDAADDPAIYYHAADPSASIVLGSSKSTGADGGVHSFDLSGTLLDSWLIGEVNAVDLRDLARYPVASGWAGRVLVVGTERSGEDLAFGWLNRTTGEITSAGTIAVPFEPYGCCLYVSPVDAAVYCFVSEATGGSGGLRQYELTITGDTVSGSSVRTLDTATLSEGMDVDEIEGLFFLSEEDAGFYVYDAEPDGGTSRTAIDTTSGNLSADAEGVTVIPALNGQPGVIIVSSQGDSTFAAYELASPHDFIGSFTIGTGAADAANNTDGIAAYRARLNSTYPHGILVAHDDTNSGGSASNFKFVDLGDLLGPITFPISFSGTTATVSGLINGFDYEFRVAAINTNGQGDWSTTAGPYTPLGTTGSGTPSLDALTSTGSGTHTAPTITGSGTPSLDALTSTGSGTHTAPTITGSGTPSLDALTSTGSGTHTAPTITGSGTPSLDAITSTGSGTHTAPTITGSGTPSLDALTSTGSGTHTAPTITGSGTPSLDALTSTGSGTAGGAPTGSGAPALDALTSTGSGTHTAPTITGSGAPSLDALTSTGSGEVGDVPTGTGSPSLSAITATGTGTLSIGGSGAPSLAALTSSGSGTAVFEGTIEGSGELVLAGVTASGHGMAPRRRIRRRSGYVPPNDPAARRAMFDLIRRVDDLEP